MSVLAPRLTALDRRVLARLPATDEAGRRAASMFQASSPGPWCPAHGHLAGLVSGTECDACARRLAWLAAEREAHSQILRGLEACGYAVCRNGWWRRAPEGTR